MKIRVMLGLVALMFATLGGSIWADLSAKSDSIQIRRDLDVHAAGQGQRITNIE